MNKKIKTCLYVHNCKQHFYPILSIVFHEPMFGKISHQTVSYPMFKDGFPASLVGQLPPDFNTGVKRRRNEAIVGFGSDNERRAGPCARERSVLPARQPHALAYSVHGSKSE